MEICLIFYLYEKKRCNKGNGNDTDSKYYSLSFIGFHTNGIWFFKDLYSPALMVLRKTPLPVHIGEADFYRPLDLLPGGKIGNNQYSIWFRFVRIITAVPSPIRSVQFLFLPSYSFPIHRLYPRLLRRWVVVKGAMAHLLWPSFFPL